MNPVTIPTSVSSSAKNTPGSTQILNKVAKEEQPIIQVEAGLITYPNDTYVIKQEESSDRIWMSGGLGRLETIEEEPTDVDTTSSDTKKAAAFAQELDEVEIKQEEAEIAQPPTRLSPEEQWQERMASWVKSVEIKAKATIKEEPCE
jgi:hypothetical protein